VTVDTGITVLLKAHFSETLGLSESAHAALKKANILDLSEDETLSINMVAALDSEERRTKTVTVVTNFVAPAHTNYRVESLKAHLIDSLTDSFYFTDD
jgi:hypothetical protein